MTHLPTSSAPGTLVRRWRRTLLGRPISILPLVLALAAGQDLGAGQTAIAATTGADLSVRMTVDNPAPSEEFTILYTITVMNSGPEAATNIAILNAPPSGLTFGAWQASQGSYNFAARTWLVGALANGASATLNVRAGVVIGTANGMITNVAEVSASDQQDPDSQPNNQVPGEDDYSMVRITVQPRVGAPTPIPVAPAQPAPTVVGGASAMPTAVPTPTATAVPRGAVPTALPRIGGPVLPAAWLTLTGAALAAAGWLLRPSR